MSARGSLGFGFLGGACCVIPAALSAVGLGTASPLAFLKPYQPFLVAGAVVMLGLAWRNHYNARSACSRCADQAEPRRVPWTLAAMSVLGVDVDLESGAALVAVDPAGDPGLAALLEAVRAAGYKATA